MPLINEATGEMMSDEQAQELIRKTVHLAGRLILECPMDVPIGFVMEWAGLPFRAVRKVSFAEALADDKLTGDLWGEREIDEGGFYFEVEVAD